jgi:hypothetical protein
MLVIQDEALANRLRSIAENEHRSVEAVLKSLLEAYPESEPEQDVENDPDLAAWRWSSEHLDEIAFGTDNPIDPRQADDILDAEFADYLLKRANDGNANSD